MRYRLISLILLTFIAHSLAAQVNYRPQPFGVVKTKYEVSTYDGAGMFSVRNSRMGIRGNIAENVRYSVLAEISSQGTISMLDAFVGYGIGNFEIIVGEQDYGLSSELSRGAGRNYFANRSFVGKFITRTYADGVSAGVFDLGSRDLGGMIKYSYGGAVPLELSLGLFNGSGVLNPQWRDGVNVAARLDLGSSGGFSGGAGYYGGKTSTEYRMDVVALGGRYHGDNLHAEVEAAVRWFDTPGKKDVMTMAVVYALYRFPLNNKYIKALSPLLRYDIADNVKYSHDSAILSAAPQRVTAGLTIGLSEKELKTEIRFNYEHYFFNEKPAHLSENRLFQNKFVVEFFASF